MNPIAKRIKKVAEIPWVQFVIYIFQRFGDNNGAFYAAGMAFFILLSIAPVLLSGVALLSYFITVHEAALKVTDTIEGLLPSGGARQEAVKFLTANLHLDQQLQQVIKHRGIAGFFGMLTLMWSALQVFINAATAMNAMWEVKETRNWFLVRGLALLLMFYTAVLTVLSLILSRVPTEIEKYRHPIVHHLPMSVMLITVLFEVIALIVNTLMYVLIYKLLPNAKVSWLAALAGGVGASLLFEVAKKVVASYLLRANHSVYGDLANLILFILWIYYSMIILLLGAELTVAIARKPDEKLSAEPAPTS